MQGHSLHMAWPANKQGQRTSARSGAKASPCALWTIHQIKRARGRKRSAACSTLPRPAATFAPPLLTACLPAEGASGPPLSSLALLLATVACARGYGGTIPYFDKQNSKKQGKKKTDDQLKTVMKKSGAGTWRPCVAKQPQRNGWRVAGTARGVESLAPRSGARL